MRHVQIADYTFVPLIHKKRIAVQLSALDGRIARQNARIHIAENHVRRRAVIPSQFIRPHFRLLLQQRSQVSRGEVPEIDDFHVVPVRLDVPGALRGAVSTQTWSLSFPSFAEQRGNTKEQCTAHVPV